MAEENDGNRACGRKNARLQWQAAGRELRIQLNTTTA